MVLVELVEALLRFVAEFVGANGLAIGLVAAVSVGLYYLREAAGVFVVIARYARMLSIVGFLLLAVLVVGTATGAIDLSADSSVISSFASTVVEAVT